MNRTKHPLSARLNKKIEKELRLAQTASKESDAYADELTAREMLKKFPKKSSKKKLLMPAGLPKKKHAKKHSKRTTPGNVPSNSTPRNVHMEGSRWMKTTLKQTLADRQVLAKKGPLKK
jgi:hypothetical protein